MKGKSVFLQNLLFLEYALKVRLYEEQPDPKKHFRVIRECFAPYNVGLYFQKKSLYKRYFDKTIGRMLQGGLMEAMVLESVDKSQQVFWYFFTIFQNRKRR